VPLTLCVLLYAAPGAEALLVEYEDHVLPLLDAHGGRLLQRLRNAPAADGPFEVHVIEFSSEAALQQYMDDPARHALSESRDRAIARTEVLRVRSVGERSGP
jgi:uncharacterized protein (DUF1330 family)